MMQLSLPMPGLAPPVFQHNMPVTPVMPGEQVEVVEIEAVPPAPLHRVVTLEAQPPDPASIAAERRGVVGSWNGGRRYLQHTDGLVNIWFHFAADGHAVFSVRREGQRCATLSAGRWEIAGGLLTLRVGRSLVEGPFVLRDDVMQWAGQTLMRVAQQPLQVEQV